MNWKYKVVTGAALMTLTIGLSAATAAPAAAMGPCPKGKLCLYEGVGYIHLDVTSTSTKACIYLFKFGDYKFKDGIGSYINDLPVNAVVYHRSGSSYIVDGTIRPQGFSSMTGGYFGKSGAVCMGGVKP
ncbi:peptidase inhibitor family I36 protein [Streptomyces sp. NPDC091272]|uniref:peptidase inhibitor family I36 protein n=1 Tax=Streptomyces sp. NPDC091272 TaxID=3365981 RepID=UPI003805B1E8